MAFLEVTDLYKNFGETQVLQGINFGLEKGQVLSIIGSSGSGKTTLLRCLNFLETPDTGSITVEGKTLFDSADQTTLSDEAIRQNRLHFGLVFQNFNLFPQYSVLKNVTLAPDLQRPDKKKENKENALALLEQVGNGVGVGSGDADAYLCAIDGHLGGLSYAPQIQNSVLEDLIQLQGEGVANKTREMEILSHAGNIEESICDLIGIESRQILGIGQLDLIGGGQDRFLTRCCEGTEGRDRHALGVLTEDQDLGLTGQEIHSHTAVGGGIAIDGVLYEAEAGEVSADGEGHGGVGGMRAILVEEHEWFGMLRTHGSRYTFLKRCIAHHLSMQEVVSLTSTNQVRLHG